MKRDWVIGGIMVAALPVERPTAMKKMAKLIALSVVGVSAVFAADRVKPQETYDEMRIRENVGKLGDWPFISEEQFRNSTIYMRYLPPPFYIKPSKVHIDGILRSAPLTTTAPSTVPCTGVKKTEPMAPTTQPVSKIAPASQP